VKCNLPPSPAYKRDLDRKNVIIFRAQNKYMGEEFVGKSMDPMDTIRVMDVWLCNADDSSLSFEKGTWA
jgi:hypothetical protein